MQWRPQAEPSNAYVAQVLDGSESLEPTRIDYEAIVDHLSGISQQLCRQLEDSTYLLCHHLTTVSQGKIQLLLHKATNPMLLSSSTASLRVSVVYLDHMYGTLHVSLEPGQTLRDNVVPMNVIHHLAEKCGWILYTCEVTALIQSQCQQLNYNIQCDLTQREKNVVQPR